MAPLLPAGVVGLFIGFLLGVLCMALLAASNQHALPKPPPVRTYAESPGSSKGRAPSWDVVRGIAQFPEEVAGARAREHA